MPSVYCVLCGNRDKSVSYHAFPKQDEIRKQWLAFCGIKENVLNIMTRLCSNHFRDKDLKKKVRGVCLKVNAVPSFHTKKRKILTQADSTVSETGKGKQKCIVTDNLNVINNTSSTVTSSSQSSNCQTSLQIEPQCSVGIGTSDSSIKEEEPVQLVNDSPSTPPRDEAFEDSNLQTATKPILDHTPRRAQRALNVAKRTIVQQQQKIKTLQQTHNRLTARFRTMKNLIKDLKHKNLLAETAAENLKDLSRNSQETTPDENTKSCRKSVESANNNCPEELSQNKSPTRMKSPMMPMKSVKQAASKKNPFEITAALQQLDKIAQNSTEEKPYEQFGKFIAAELRQLPEGQAILVQQEIQNYIIRSKLFSLGQVVHINPQQFVNEITSPSSDYLSFEETEDEASVCRNGAKNR